MPIHADVRKCNCSRDGKSNLPIQKAFVIAAETRVSLCAGQNFLTAPGTCLYPCPFCCFVSSWITVNTSMPNVCNYVIIILY